MERVWDVGGGRGNSVSSLSLGTRGGQAAQICAWRAVLRPGERPAALLHCLPDCCRACYGLPAPRPPTAGFFQKHCSLSQQTAKSELLAVASFHSRSSRGSRYHGKISLYLFQLEIRLNIPRSVPGEAGSPVHRALFRVLLAFLERGLCCEIRGVFREMFLVVL